MEGKRKIALVLPLRILASFDEVAKWHLGIGRSAFFALGALLLLAKIAPILAPKRRLALLNDLQEMLLAEIEKARKSA